MMPASTTSTAQLQHAVLLELTRDMGDEGTGIGVQVDDGIVTLTGTMSRYVRKLAAQEAAHRAQGVRAVANDIAVRVPGAGIRTSADIARDVRRALEWDVLVPHERIQATVADGWVTLEGRVERWHYRDDAEWAVRHLAGVRGVMNRITVGEPESQVASDTVERAALLARSRHFAGAKRVIS